MEANTTQYKQCYMYFQGDTLSTLAIALGAFAAGAATFALIQNSNQATIDDLNAVKTRVSSLESDQTNICTTVKNNKYIIFYDIG